MINLILALVLILILLLVLILIPGFNSDPSAGFVPDTNLSRSHEELFSFREIFRDLIQ